MSGYWSAMTGTALILSPEEYDNMLLNYLKTAFKPDADKKDASHYMNSCEELSDEIPIIKTSCLDVIKPLYPTMDAFLDKWQNNAYNSNDDISIAKNLVYFNRYNTDEYSGGGFYPIDTSANEEFNGQRIPYFDVANDSEIMYTRFSTLSIDLLKDKHYTSNDDIINEFKDAIGTYLPDDFDWKKHVGEFRCAAYA